MPTEDCRTEGHQRDPKATLLPKLVLSKPNTPSSPHQQLQDVNPGVQKGPGFPIS